MRKFLEWFRYSDDSTRYRITLIHAMGTVLLSCSAGMIFIVITPDSSPFLFLFGPLIGILHLTYKGALSQEWQAKVFPEKVSWGRAIAYPFLGVFVGIVLVALTKNTWTVFLPILIAFALAIKI